MDDEPGEFYIEPEQQQVREVPLLEMAQSLPAPPKSNSKPTSHKEKQVVGLKMIQIQREIQPSFYSKFRINMHKQQSQEQDNNQNQQCQTEPDKNPFEEFYSRQQLVYQRFNNAIGSVNRFKGTTYHSGSFINRQVIQQYAKEHMNCIWDIVKEYEQQNGDGELPEHVPITNKDTDNLKFDSNFQSGNLFSAYKISHREYDLVMQNDNLSTGNNQWFYFSVEGMVPGAQYTFNVVNFTKSDSLFNYGMGPVMHSVGMQKKIGVQWVRGGKDVIYKKGAIPRENGKKNYYRLTFRITWRIANDKVYFAYTFPYTFSKLNQKITFLTQTYPDIVSRLSIGKTLSKKSIPGLLITQSSQKTKSSGATTTSKKIPKKAIIIMARQHPGQTQGSYVCDGVLDKFVDRSCRYAEYLRKNYMIYVIPMVNIDGVVYGHYRTNLGGKDLNRKWDSNQKQLSCPQILAVKSFLAQISKQHQIRFILDLHGHSKKLNSFFYGNPHPDLPELPRIYPYICSKMHPAVQFSQCTFMTEEYKRKAARVYLSFLYKLIHVYTYQVSFYGFYDPSAGKEGGTSGVKQFTSKQFAILGANLINALGVVLEGESATNGKSGSNVNGISTNLREKDSGNSNSINLYNKYLTQLKTNKKLLETGIEYESGSDSKPEQFQINEKQLPQMILKQAVPTPAQTQPQKKPSSRKGNRQPFQTKQISKPVRNIKFLQISRVNSVLPDRYQLGLQPIRKKQSQIEQKRNKSGIAKVTLHCQTDISQISQNNSLTNPSFPSNLLLPYKIQYSQKDILQCNNLSNSVRFDTKSLAGSNSFNLNINGGKSSVNSNATQRKYSSLIKNTRNNNNIIFKIDFVGSQRSSSIFGNTSTGNAYNSNSIAGSNQRQKKILYNAFSQTILSFINLHRNQSTNSNSSSYKQTQGRHDRIKSSQLFPLVESPQSERQRLVQGFGNNPSNVKTKKSQIKYETMKISFKKQTQIFLNGMVKKFLIQRQRQKQRCQLPQAQVQYQNNQNSGQKSHVTERPLSIKRKQIYKK